MTNPLRDLPWDGIDSLRGGTRDEVTIPERPLDCAAQLKGQALSALRNEGPSDGATNAPLKIVPLCGV